MSGRKKPFHYYDECWQQSFWIMEGWAKEDALKFLGKTVFGAQELKGQGRTMWNTNGSGPIIIWTQKTRDFGKRAAILAHECIHAAHICLSRAGVVADFNNDEPVTYLVTVLMRKALS